MKDLAEFYRRLWAEAAESLSARTVEMGDDLWRVERGLQFTVIRNFRVPLDNPVVLNVAGDKALSHRIMMREGLPVPEHEVYTLGDFQRAQRFMERHPGNCFVVKPSADTAGAAGVTTHLQGLAECRSASVLASLYGERILIERWIPGESYRLLFLDGQLIHASRRRGQWVLGDGRSTITQLVRKQDAHHGVRAPSIQAQRDMAGTLRAQGLELDSVPECGRSVLVRSVGTLSNRNVEIRTVFDEEATAMIGSELRDQVARAVRAIGSEFAGVDVLTINPQVALERTGGVINEINTTPGLHHHYGLRGVCEGPGPAVRVLARLLKVSLDATSASTNSEMPIEIRNRRAANGPKAQGGS